MLFRSIKLNDDERLSRPSFERMKSGFEIAGTDSLALGSVRQVTVNGEVSEANRKQLETPNVNMATHFRRVFRNSSATFKSEASLDNRSKNRGFQHLAPKDKDSFAIAQKDNLTKAEAFKKLTFSSFAEANDMIQGLPKSQQKELQVIENQEFV